MKDITCRYDSGYIGFWAQALALNLVQVDQHGRFLLVTIHKHHKKSGLLRFPSSLPLALVECRKLQEDTLENSLSLGPSIDLPGEPANSAYEIFVLLA